MSVTPYDDIEHGDKDLKLSRLQDIADALDIKASKLLDLNDKAVLNINLNRKYKGDNNVSVYFSPNAEIEKLQMQLDMKDKELAMKDRENAYLKELLEMHKNPKVNLSE